MTVLHVRFFLFTFFWWLDINTYPFKSQCIISKIQILQCVFSTLQNSLIGFPNPWKKKTASAWWETLVWVFPLSTICFSGSERPDTDLLLLHSPSSKELFCLPKCADLHIYALKKHSPQQLWQSAKCKKAKALKSLTQCGWWGDEIAECKLLYCFYRFCLLVKKKKKKKRSLTMQDTVFFFSPYIYMTTC